MNAEAMARYFETALAYVTKHYPDELKYVEQRKFSSITAFIFFEEYVFVVLNSGMKYKVAMKMYKNFMKNADLNTIGHLGKRKAIGEAMHNYADWFLKLQATEDKLAFLDSLPFIGKVTKYHLARNLGLDYAKPDRHLVRLAQISKYACAEKKCKCAGKGERVIYCTCKFNCVADMCSALATKFNLRIGTVDFVLWAFLKDGVNGLLNKT